MVDGSYKLQRKYLFYWSKYPEIEKPLEFEIEISDECKVKDAIKIVKKIINNYLKDSNFKLVDDNNLFDLKMANKKGFPKKSWPAYYPE